jgi:hypothetical protein
MEGSLEVSVLLIKKNGASLIVKVGCDLLLLSC